MIAQLDMTNASSLVKQPQSGEELRDAALDGLPCRAMAWVDITRLEVIRKGEARPIEGIRTWRGIAVVDSVTPKVVSTWTNRTIPYTGCVRVGEDKRDVKAEVFITSCKRNLASRAGKALPEEEAASVYFIEFTGAGNL